jgi:hypothetical protein
MLDGLIRDTSISVFSLVYEEYRIYVTCILFFNKLSLPDNSTHWSTVCLHLKKLFSGEYEYCGGAHVTN